MFFSGVAADVRSFVQTVTINQQTLPSTPQYVSERELVPVQYMSNLGAQDNVKPDIFNKTKETILKYFLIFFYTNLYARLTNIYIFCNVELINTESLDLYNNFKKHVFVNLSRSKI